MATVLQLLLDGQLSTESLVLWLKDQSDRSVAPGGLGNVEETRSEFIAYFLNFLRDQTLHLLQNAKSSNPSPVKTPSTQKGETPVQKRKGSSAKRVQLFASSPGECIRLETDNVSPLVSPNSSFDSAHLHQRFSNSDKTFRHDQHRKRWDNDTPNRHKSSLSHTPEPQRSKQKLSLGEFILTPESAGSKKRSSPYSSREASPSPTAPPTNRRITGKRKGGSPLVRNQDETMKDKTPPIFNLVSMNDFPPVSGGDQKQEKSELKSTVKTPETSKPRRVTLTPVTKPQQNQELCHFSEAMKSAKEVSHVGGNRSIKTKQNCVDGTINSEAKENKSSQKRKPRRINPTPVSRSPGYDGLSPFSQVSETSVASAIGAAGDAGAGNSTEQVLSEERELLKQEKARRLQLMKSDLRASPQSSTPPADSAPCVTPTKAVLEQKASTIEYIQADPHLVTHKYALDVMADLYARALSEHLFPNLTVELYFLTQLLTSVGEEVKDSTDICSEMEEMKYFSSVHNAVYFAVFIMERELSILTRLDKSTLRFLSDNTRIADFSPNLQHNLRTAYENADKAKSGLSFPRSPIGGVSFQADTDNRKNFPNDKCFHQFKKQRDVFYEIIRDWEDKHQESGWSLVDMQGERIRWLVTYRTDLTNHLHFARLFLSQLIVMCKGDNSIKSDGEDETVTLLAQLKKTNPEKFKKLQERFIMPFSLGGPCPSPTFSGYQEFFHDFIIAAGNAVFNQHLMNTLVAKVTELNSTEFGAGKNRQVKSTSSETEEEEDQQELFSSCMMTLRLLGKFLGFLTFLPYQTVEVLPDSFRTSYVVQRNQIPPPFDVVRVAHTAIQCHRQVLTVPWLVEFASQMDPVAPCLDIYECFLSYLRLVLKLSWEKVSSDQCFYGNLMVVILISWLFDTTAMPDGLFFKEVSVEDSITDQSADVQTLLPLDDLDLVNQDLLYTCCPYVAEMRNLLMEFAMGTNSRGAVRKITPTAASNSQTTTYTHKQLQTQLEENFFHNHPASLRRTVEFVAERTASNFIKKFRSSILPSQLMSAKVKVKELKQKLRNLEPDKRKMGLEAEEVGKLVPQVHGDLKNLVHKQQKEFCHIKTMASLKILLPEEQPEAVVSVAANIASQLAESRILHWINSHITAAVIQSELCGSTEKITCTHLLMGDHSSLTGPGDQPDYTQHKENARGLSDIICDLKEMVASLMLKHRTPFDVEACITLLSETNTALQERQDNIPLVVKSLAQLVFNLALTAVIEKPGKVATAICNKCIWLWKQKLGQETEFEGICCNRVAHGLSGSHNLQLTWSCYSHLVISMMEEKIMEPTVFREGCHKVISLAKYYHTNLEFLGQVVCDIYKHFHQSEAIISCFCKTLEELFHQSAEGSHLARIILPLLDKYVPLDTQTDHRLDTQRDHTLDTQTDHTLDTQTDHTPDTQTDHKVDDNENTYMANEPETTNRNIHIKSASLNLNKLRRTESVKKFSVCEAGFKNNPADVTQALCDEVFVNDMKTVSISQRVEVSEEENPINTVSGH